MCYACHLEGCGLNGRTPRRLRGRQRPTLDADTLAAFWMEDTSDDDPLIAAAEFFRAKTETIIRMRHGMRMEEMRA